MKNLLVLAALSAALATSACATGAHVGRAVGWQGHGAQPFDASRTACTAQAGQDESASAFIQCMSEKGWTQR